MSEKSSHSPHRNRFKNWRRRYWRDQVNVYPETRIEDEQNLQRMRNGQPPRRLATVRHKRDGYLFEVLVVKELHHVFGIHPEEDDDDQTVIELWPWEHSLCDPDRVVTYEFVKWGGLL